MAKGRTATTKHTLKEPSGGMKLRVYEVVHRAVEAGVAYGVQRAYKYEDEPSRGSIEDQVAAAVMLELHEIIDFVDE